MLNVSDAVASRRSVRAFRDEPVSRDVLERVLDKARRAPSGGNVQPWHAVVATGDGLRKVIDMVRESLAEGRIEPEYEIYPPRLVDPYRSRRFECGEQMYAALGIGREDKPARLANLARNFEGFGAPVVLFCHTPAFMGKPQWSDLGMWLQTIMLLLREEGLDSCAQEAWSQQGATVKAALDIPEDHHFFCGLAIGFADPGKPVNDFEIARAPLAESVSFRGF